MILQLLAQTAETADGAVTLAERILAGGLPLLCLLLLGVVGWLYYRERQRNERLEGDFRNRVQELLKDQIAQQGPLTETLTTTNSAISKYDDTMNDVKSGLRKCSESQDELRRAIEELRRVADDLRRNE